MDDQRLKTLLRTAGTRLVGLLALACCEPATAVEVRLRGQATCATGVVRLSDVADLHGEAQEVATLTQVELLPAPQAGQEKRLSSRELHDLLELRGVDTTMHPVTGAASTVITGGSAAERRAGRTSRGTAPSRRQLETTVAQAVKKHLEIASDGQTLGEIRVELSAAEVQQLAAERGPWTALGGQAPWTGPQRFTLSAAGGAASLTLSVEVAPARQALALRRPLNRGTVLGPADVEPAPQHASARLDDAFENLEDVVGKELLQGGVAGQVLRRAMLRAPLLVKQGQPVTVYSRAAGIQIRTVGLAKDDASQGELVAVESPETKQRYFARVVGMQEVEIWATATAASSVAASGVAAATSGSRAGAAR